MLAQKKSKQKRPVQEKVTEWYSFAVFEWYEITQKWRHWSKLRSASGIAIVHSRPAHPLRVPSFLTLSCSTFQDHSVMHFSIALIILSLILIFCKGDRRTFDSSFTIACFLNDFPDQYQPLNWMILTFSADPNFFQFFYFGI